MNINVGETYCDKVFIVPTTKFIGTKLDIGMLSLQRLLMLALKSIAFIFQQIEQIHWKVINCGYLLIFEIEHFKKIGIRTS